MNFMMYTHLGHILKLKGNICFCYKGHIWRGDCIYEVKCQEISIHLITKL
jgi:hypothetical protein